MAAVTEPSCAEVAGWACLQDVLGWAGVAGDGGHSGTVARSLLVLAGIDPSTRCDWDSVAVFVISISGT